MVTVKVNGASTLMKLDTGAGISVINKQTYNQLWPENKRPPLQSSSILLKTYMGEKLPVLSMIDVVAEYKQQ